MWASFNEIGRVEIATQSTVEISLQNMTRVYFRQLLEQHLSNARIAAKGLVKNNNNKKKLLAKVTSK